MAHITLLALPDCAVSGITGTIDAFAIANKWHKIIEQDTDLPLFSWDIVTLDGNPVQGDNRILIQPHASIDHVETTDFILIPGFLPPLECIDNVPDVLTQWLRDRHEENITIGSICTGSFLLAETGLLDGKTATTNWLFANYFRKRYPSVNLKPERILTEDSGFICSGATTSFLDLCLFLMEKYGSEKLAACCSKSLLAEPGRQSQSPYFIFDYQKNHADEKVIEAQNYMETRYTETISVEALALDLGISPRHFKRRFKKATGDSPLLYLQRIRIEAAKQMLSNTTEAIDEITRQVGYENANSFRKLFKKNTGLSPREYRVRFARKQGPAYTNQPGVTPHVLSA